MISSLKNDELHLSVGACKRTCNHEASADDLEDRYHKGQYKARNRNKTDGLEVSSIPIGKGQEFTTEIM